MRKWIMGLICIIGLLYPETAHAEEKGLMGSMKGAAISHVAYLNHVPFVIVRAIADDAKEFDKLILLACRQSTAIVEQMMKGEFQ
ncbi:hypothetical protein [Ectobacillus ponti]|uniref:5'-methylthioadenosine/S-adenosylhomocysteine nucleosidase n=1 Tax=Ectobacillus ponti TaxID=2961894 RepID=A0AA42BPN1_9BACI|nr:hypothetical protein [Ectobacillus ponti]MCP8967704.1 hypothetical protein [Ectobacillus ponti]